MDKSTQQQSDGRQSCLVVVKDVAGSEEGVKVHKTSHSFTLFCLFCAVSMTSGTSCRKLHLLCFLSHWQLPIFCLPTLFSLSSSLLLSAILMLNTYSVAGRCRNNRRAQQSFSMPGRKWPGQLLAIQPGTLGDLHYGTEHSPPPYFHTLPGFQGWKIMKVLIFYFMLLKISLSHNMFVTLYV